MMSDDYAANARTKMKIIAYIGDRPCLQISIYMCSWVIGQIRIWSGSNFNNYKYCKCCASPTNIYIIVTLHVKLIVYCCVQYRISGIIYRDILTNCRTVSSFINYLIFIYACKSVVFITSPNGRHCLLFT